MATDYSNSQEAQDRLALLEADRERLANNLATPWTLMTAAGAALAWFVADGVTANPGEGYTAGDGSLLAIAVLFIIGYFVQQQTGVQFRRWGGRAFAGGQPRSSQFFTLAVSRAIIREGDCVHKSSRVHQRPGVRRSDCP